MLRRDAELGGDVGDVERLDGVGDVDVGGHRRGDVEPPDGGVGRRRRHGRHQRRRGDGAGSRDGAGGRVGAEAGRERVVARGWWRREEESSLAGGRGAIVYSRPRVGTAAAQDNGG